MTTVAPHPSVPRDAAELLRLVQEAGGTFNAGDLKLPERRAWRRAIFLLINDPDLRKDSRIRHPGRDKGQLIISVVPQEEATPITPAPIPVPVPSTLRGAHPVVRATADLPTGRQDWIDTRRVDGVVHLIVSRGQLNRALRVVQGLIEEAGRRGFEVIAGRHPRCGLTLVKGTVFSCETHDSGGNLQGSARAFRCGAPPPRLRTSVGHRCDGRLQVRSGHDSYGPRWAADGKRWTLEDRLHRVFDRLDERVTAAEEREVEAERRRAEALAGWERAMTSARLQLVEHHRVSWLDRQLANREKVRAVRSFVEDARHSVALTKEDLAWLEWIETHIRDLDPLCHALSGPQAPEATPESLKPFLGGVSPYGPARVW